MTGKKLKVNDDILMLQAIKIKDAVEDYKNIGERPFDVDIEALEKMNSDFTAKLKVMVKNLNSGNKKIIKALEKLADNTEKIVDNLQEMDECAAESMEG